VNNPQYIEFRTWTECFGDIDSITSYLELQKYELEYPGGPSEYVDVAGPDEAHFPGFTSTGVVYGVADPAVAGSSGLGVSA
jgi:hypothetical protein